MAIKGLNGEGAPGPDGFFWWSSLVSSGQWSSQRLRSHTINFEAGIMACRESLDNIHSGEAVGGWHGGGKRDPSGMAERGDTSGDVSYVLFEATMNKGLALRLEGQLVIEKVEMVGRPYCCQGWGVWCFFFFFE